MKKVTYKSFVDIAKELNLTLEQCQDTEINIFINEYKDRANTGDWYQFIDGNGICEINKINGTQITTVLDNKDFDPEFPLNCDLNISNNCKIGCKFCYQGCSINGKHADIKKFINNKKSFLYTLHEGTELAINGNEPFHPDLELLLKFCKRRGILANLTVNEISLVSHNDIIEEYLKKGLIHGIGVSPNMWSVPLLDFCQKHSTAVIHTIAGITTPQQYQCLFNKDVKILILGYKNFGRGENYLEEHDENVKDNIRWLQNNIKEMRNHFKVLSFDNLAIEQLNPKSFLTKKEWEKFYRGDDGHHTLFIDLVNETFAKNSVQPKENHKPLMNDIKDMLKSVKENN